MQHSFDIEIAQKYGILEAILLQNLYFWVEKNRANEVHYYDGRYWTYNSRKAFSQIFPYSTERQIRTALEKLQKNQLIITGNYNKAGFDKTLWYTLTDKGYSELQKCPIDLTQKSNDVTTMSNGSDTDVKPIPDINTDNKPDNNCSLSDDFEKLWNIYPRKDGKATAFKHYKSWINGKEYAGKREKITNREMWYAIKIYSHNIKENKTEPQYIKMGSTFFNEAIFEYVIRYNKAKEYWERELGGN